MRKGFLTVLLSVLAGGLTAFGVVKANEKTLNPVQVVGENGSVEYRTVNLADSDYPDFTYAAESAVEAVVYVEVTVQSRAQSMNIDPFFRYFFGDEWGFGQPQSREQKGSGSGVIIRPDGYIVTNNLVVAGASKISVTLNDNQQYDATIVGTDPATDVAIIKVDAQNLPTLPMGDSDQLRLGEWVLAIGSPLGAQLRSTITAGIVSAKGRSMPDGSGEFKIESFIQTDAAVNPGNSGGALVNTAGELVGINTSIISLTGSYAGYSFAVPVNIVKKVTDDFINYGSVQRAMLGISIRETDQGVVVAEVKEHSVADEGGLKAGDVLKEINFSQITSASDLQFQINKYRPGEKIVLTIEREGAVKEMILNL